MFSFSRLRRPGTFDDLIVELGTEVLPMGRQLVLALLLVAFLVTVAPHCCISVSQVSIALSAFSSCFFGVFRLEAQPRSLTHPSPFDQSSRTALP